MHHIPILWLESHNVNLLATTTLYILLYYNFYKVKMFFLIFNISMNIVCFRVTQVDAPPHHHDLYTMLLVYTCNIV